MRKWVLIAAFALASVSVQAGERIDRVPAENDAPAPVAAPAATALVAAAPAAAPPAAVKPQVARKQVSRKQAARKQVSRSGQAWRQSDEQKARRIAAEYGISW